MLAAAVASIAGLRDSHRRQGFYLDARGVVAYLRAGECPTDAVLAPSDPGSSVPLLYYGLAELRSQPLGSPGATRLVAERTHRLWLISVLPAPAPSAPALLAYDQAGARSLGYRALSARIFPASAPLGVVLLAPVAHGDASPR